MIGSLPLTDPQDAMRLVLENLDEAPIWPELPARSFQEEVDLRSTYHLYCVQGGGEVCSTVPLKEGISLKPIDAPFDPESGNRPRKVEAVPREPPPDLGAPLGHEHGELLVGGELVPDRHPQLRPA